jgi:hypothetical protein
LPPSTAVAAKAATTTIPILFDVGAGRRSFIAVYG